MRDLERLQNARVFAHTLIRLQFPDRVVLQVCAAPGAKGPRVQLGSARGVRGGGVGSSPWGASIVHTIDGIAEDLSAAPSRRRRRRRWTMRR